MEELQLVATVISLVGAVYSVAKVEFSIRTEIHQVEKSLTKDLDEIEDKLNNAIASNRHGLSLHEERFNAHRTRQKDDFEEIHRRLNELNRRISRKLGDVHEFLKSRGFFDKATQTDTEQ